MQAQNLRQLHRTFWGVTQSPFFIKLKTKIPNERTLDTDGEEDSDFTVISLPDGVKFPHGESRILVTPIYYEFWTLVSDDNEHWQQHINEYAPFQHLSHATVIKGQPGIGEFFVPFFFWL
jgi:hypothetical protein